MLDDILHVVNDYSYKKIFNIYGKEKVKTDLLMDVLVISVNF